MVEGSGYRLLRVSRGAHELSGTGCVPISRRGSLATLAPATKSKGRDDVGTNDEDRCGLAAATSNPTSMAGQAVCRQTPEVGAECVNCACSDLCGGRSVMGVPTAITRRIAIQSSDGNCDKAGSRSIACPRHCFGRVEEEVGTTTVCSNFRCLLCILALQRFASKIERLLKRLSHNGESHVLVFRRQPAP